MSGAISFRAKLIACTLFSSRQQETIIKKKKKTHENTKKCFEKVLENLLYSFLTIYLYVGFYMLLHLCKTFIHILYNLYIH